MFVRYRLGQHEHFPAQIEDVEAAVRWLKEVSFSNKQMFTKTFK